MADRVGIKGRAISLYVLFRDNVGNPAYTDDTPRVEVSDAAGTIIRQLSKSGVSQDSDTTGLYRFDYTIPLSNTTDGYFTDRWVAKIGNETVQNSFSFLVTDSGSAEQGGAPEYPPSGSYEFSWTKCEAEAIDYLISILKKRLNSDGVSRTPDGQGGYIETTCNVFSDDQLILFLVNSLSEFNQYPHFTNFNFCDEVITGIFTDIIIQGGVLLGLAAQALIERGREFTLNDNGISYSPPAVSEILNTQYSAQLSDYKEKLRMIKASLKPAPKGTGTFRVTAVSPLYARLRHLRARRLY